MEKTATIKTSLKTSIAEIQELKTTVHSVPKDCSGIHESTLRSYQILQKVKDLLNRGTPTDVILELIWEMESLDIEIKSKRSTLTFSAVEEILE